MKFSKVILKLTSPYATDWQADTIWGHLCWALRFSYGENELTNFIARYGEGEPPILVSNGFPGDLLPRPVLPEKHVTERSDFAMVKKQKKIRWLTPDEFMKTQNGEELVLSKKNGETETVMLKNQINRFTGTTSGGEVDEPTGRLFSFAQHHLDEMAAPLRQASNRKGTPVIGTRLIREWNGGRYEVTVVHDGFEFQGKTYRSLTAITKTITGTHWNGPAFFGLRRNGNAK